VSRTLDGWPWSWPGDTPRRGARRRPPRASTPGRPYLVEVRAYLPDSEAAQIAKRFHVPDAKLGALVERLLRLGPDLLAEAAPDLFPGAEHAVSLWREAWTAVRLQERYAPLQGLDAYQVSPSLTGEILRPLVGSTGDIRMHVSNGALASFADTLPLLHPFGRPGRTPALRWTPPAASSPPGSRPGASSSRPRSPPPTTVPPARPRAP